jgi:hypothetical protein
MTADRLGNSSLLEDVIDNRDDRQRGVCNDMDESDRRSVLGARPLLQLEGLPTLTGFDQRFAASGVPDIVDWGFSEFIASPLTTLQHDLPEWWRTPQERFEPYQPCPDPSLITTFTAVPCAR